MTKIIEANSYSQVLPGIESAADEHKRIFEVNRSKFASWHALCDATYEKMIKAVVAFEKYRL